MTRAEQIVEDLTKINDSMAGQSISSHSEDRTVKMAQMLYQMYFMKEFGVSFVKDLPFEVVTYHTEKNTEQGILEMRFERAGRPVTIVEIADLLEGRS